MIEPVQKLDPLRLPLCGHQLIEASAGTGKTYAIGSLLLRVLLGHGRPPLPIDRVLVVTFTNAATLELHDRLRRRLAAALSAFQLGARYAAETEQPDPFLVALIDACACQATAVAQLRAALARFDEAAVFTIHSFCLRILRDRAFDSGTLLAQDFMYDDQAYRQQAVRDFWRCRIYPLAVDASILVRGQWPEPDDLLKAVQAYLGRTDLQLRGLDAMPFEVLLELARDQLRLLQAHWRDANLREGIEVSRVSRRRESGGHQDSLAAMDAWAASPEILLAWRNPHGRLESIVPLLRRYTQDALLKNPLKKGEPLACDEWFEQLGAALTTLARVLARLRADALLAIREAMQDARRGDVCISPDDLLQAMAQGLHGPGGQALGEAVRQAYPVAFIDEFQDTDPLQYQIFTNIYPVAATATATAEATAEATATAEAEAEATALVMIGDPKQAIYGFRGADVYTYLDARSAQAADARMAMATNWRSTPELLAAVARLYEEADNPFAISGINFVPVQPPPEPVSTAAGLPPVSPALVFWHVPGPAMSATSLRDALTGEVVRTLTGLASADSPHAAGADLGQVAILVRNSFEAEWVREALFRVGIACVHRSRQSVFATAEAGDLQILLAAALEPRNASQVRAALATSLLALPLDQLHSALHADDAAWQQHLDRFARYQQIGMQQGPMAMLWALLADYQVPARLLSTLEGPRRVTDLRHLCELLQREAAVLGNGQRLLHWFARQRAEVADLEEARRRLEADQDLIQIATIHSAKGLEYETVMLPFATWLREGDEDEAAFHEQDAQGRWQAVLDLMPGERTWEQVEEERLAEDLRLLYVALTRARRACFVGVGDLASGRGQSKTSKLQRTALGYLLLRSGEVPAELAGRLEELTAACPHLAVKTVEPDASSAVPGQALAPPPVARRTPFTARIRDDWRTTSYSALVQAGDSTGLWVPGAGDERYLPERPGVVTLARDQDEIAHRFPRGPRAGSCLHALLEAWPRAAANELEHVRQTLAIWGFERSADTEPEQVLAWLRRVRSTPLAADLNLASAGSGLPELQFHLPLTGFDTRHLCQLLGAHGYSDAPLAPTFVRGMMRGFIDLVLEQAGRYWVIDYKSNWLGGDASAYEPAALAASIRTHRYDLQYLIYCVALRRLLQARFGQHGRARFGGVLYLYLRGMDGNSSAQGVHLDEPDERLLDGLDALFAGRAAP